MLAHNTAGVKVDPGHETEITSWTADGLSYLIGFTGTGSFSGEFRLYVGVQDPNPVYVYMTSPGNRTAYIADRGSKLPAGTKVSLKVVHEDATDAQTFKGTILGGV
ncbi:hypothetical protein ACK8P5_26535 (plasmid) [Paenibacillus sp. EC2-1]|uniref:hypothetical protein n=1 Tax=Paenibacillus sp. EC2-1 TaxID=3388665 RepID=UPI003BEEE7C8